MSLLTNCNHYFHFHKSIRNLKQKLHHNNHDFNKNIPIIVKN